MRHLNLLGIPPDTQPAADKALGMATRCRSRTRPGDILAAADHDNPAEQELSLAGWDNAGGDTQEPARRDTAP
ncbi:hypothetical protein ACNF49_40865 [Actinomadura sp. ATCC 39365]